MSASFFPAVNQTICCFLEKDELALCSVIHFKVLTVILHSLFLIQINY